MGGMNRKKQLPPSLPPAIPSGDISCREQRFFEMRDAEAVEVFSCRVVARYRRSKRLFLDGQVKLDV